MTAPVLTTGTSGHVLAGRLGLVAAAGLLLGLPGLLGALAVVAWATFGRATKARVLALAGLALVATTVGWIALGIPDPLQVGAFTNLGGRGWLDGLSRLALGIVAGVLVVPDADDKAVATARFPAPGSRDGTSGPPGALPVSPARAPRLPEVDRMRAIAIVTVVFIHGLPYRAPITDYLDYWLSDVTRFAVPTLLLLAGWLVPQRTVGRPWVRRRLGRLLPAYVIAATVMMVLARLTPSIDARPVLRSLLLGDTVGPHYFIPVLVVMVVVTPLFTRMRPRHLAVLTGVAAIGSLVIEVVDLSLYAHNHLPLTWLPWYLLGIVGRRHRDRLADLAASWWLPAVLLATAVATTLVLADVETTPRRILTWVGMATTVGALLLATLHVAGPTRGLTTRLSSSSYVIYLYHAPVMAGLTGLFGSAVVTVRPVTATVVAVVLGMAAAQLAATALSPRGARWFGASP